MNALEKATVSLMTQGGRTSHQEIGNYGASFESHYNNQEAYDFKLVQDNNMERAGRYLSFFLIIITCL